VVLGGDKVGKDDKYTIEELFDIACEDQVEDDSRPWNFTDSCSYCGGVKAFLVWLDKHGRSK